MLEEVDVADFFDEDTKMSGGSGSGSGKDIEISPSSPPDFQDAKLFSPEVFRSQGPSMTSFERDTLPVLSSAGPSTVQNDGLSSGSKNDVAPGDPEDWDLGDVERAEDIENELSQLPEGDEESYNQREDGELSVHEDQSLERDEKASRRTGKDKFTSVIGHFEEPSQEVAEVRLVISVWSDGQFCHEWEVPSVQTVTQDSSYVKKLLDDTILTAIKEQSFALALEDLRPDMTRQDVQRALFAPSFSLMYHSRQLAREKSRHKDSEEVTRLSAWGRLPPRLQNQTAMDVLDREPFEWNTYIVTHGFRSSQREEPKSTRAEDEDMGGSGSSSATAVDDE